MNTGLETEMAVEEVTDVEATEWAACLHLFSNVKKLYPEFHCLQICESALNTDFLISGKPFFAFSRKAHSVILQESPFCYSLF